MGVELQEQRTLQLVNIGLDALCIFDHVDPDNRAGAMGSLEITEVGDIGADRGVGAVQDEARLQL
jgi:hypothetical protein